MKILIIGAAGKTGRVVVERAIAAGHTVTAFVHNASEPLDSTTLRVVEGDATDSAVMDQAVRGQDAVLDTIGGKVPFRESALETNAAATIIRSMKDNGVRRLVVLSMLGQGESEANTNFYERILMATLLQGTNKDKAGMEAIVESSDLDWIILRPPFLNDEPSTGRVRVFSAERGETAHKLSRTDLADFMITQATSNTYLRQAVTVANN